MAQVIPTGVLDQAAIELEQLAVGTDHLQAGDPLARVAIADNADATGIGGDVATDGARTARAEVDRVGQALCAGSFLHHLQWRAGLHLQAAVDRVEAEHLVHALQAEDQLAVGSDRATGQPGASARWHHGHAVRAGPAHHTLDFLDRARQGDGQRRRGPAPGPVAAVVLEIVRIGAQAQRRQFFAQGVQAWVGHRQGSCRLAGQRASGTLARPLQGEPAFTLALACVSRAPQAYDSRGQPCPAHLA